MRAVGGTTRFETMPTTSCFTKTRPRLPHRTPPRTKSQMDSLMSCMSLSFYQRYARIVRLPLEAIQTEILRSGLEIVVGSFFAGQRSESNVPVAVCGRPVVACSFDPPRYLVAEGVGVGRGQGSSWLEEMKRAPCEPLGVREVARRRPGISFDGLPELVPELRGCVFGRLAIRGNHSSPRFR